MCVCGGARSRSISTGERAQLRDDESAQSKAGAADMERKQQWEEGKWLRKDPVTG